MNRLFYVENEWVTYDQAHSLGYSISPQKLITLYDRDNNRVTIRQDSSDNTYYDSSNCRWVSDFYDLALYKKVVTSTFYRGDFSIECSRFIGSITDTSPNYILYNSTIISLDDAYENYGITTYSCVPVITDKNNLQLVWYDTGTDKYFDDRDGFHRWVDSISDVRVTLYDSVSNEHSYIYESDVSDYFYIDGLFIDRVDFYSSDNNGIIREKLLVLRNKEVYSIYYDSLSEKYCISGITVTWISRENILSLGYTFINGLYNVWRCDTQTSLPWKYI